MAHSKGLLRKLTESSGYRGLGGAGRTGRHGEAARDKHLWAATALPSGREPPKAGREGVGNKCLQVSLLHSQTPAGASHWLNPVGSQNRRLPKDTVTLVGSKRQVPDLEGQIAAKGNREVVSSPSCAVSSKQIHISSLAQNQHCLPGFEGEQGSCCL